MEQGVWNSFNLKGITMKKCTTFFLTIAVSTFLAGAAYAQELKYGQREVQVSYDGSPSIPSIVFNGEDFAAFYVWSGKEDKDIGLHMRRIGTDGKPIGAQRLVMPLEIFDPLVTAVWDGSAYTVFLSKYIGVTWYIVRVDKTGKMLAYRKVPVEQNRQLYRRAFPFVVGDRLFFFFSTTEDYFAAGGKPYMITADSKLKGKPVLTEVPAGWSQNAVVLGVALDPDKFLVYLGRYKRSFEYEIQEAALLHVGFDGELKRRIKPALSGPGNSHPAAQLNTADAYDASGPLYTGDGYLVFATRSPVFFFRAPANSFQYVNSSLKIDDTGKIIDGPYDLDHGNYQIYLDKPILLGRYVGMAIDDWLDWDTQMMLTGLRGRHITDLSVHEATYTLYYPVAVDAVYSGAGSAIVDLGLKQRLGIFYDRAIYSNIITDPPFVKPSIVYFQASSSSPFGDTRRLIMWSAAGCTNVTLTGPGFEMTNLPPVFHTVVDTSGERTKLQLAIIGTDDSTKIRKIVIEP